MEVEDEKFERPESVGSIGKVLEQVKSDTTPRYEKDRYFDSPIEGSPPPLPTAMTTDEKHQMIVMEANARSPDSTDDLQQRAKQLRIDTGLDLPEEPSTPTQRLFSI